MVIYGMMPMVSKWFTRTSGKDKSSICRKLTTLPPTFSQFRVQSQLETNTQASKWPSWPTALRPDQQDWEVAGTLSLCKIDVSMATMPMVFHNPLMTAINSAMESRLRPLTTCKYSTVQRLNLNKMVAAFRNKGNINCNSSSLLSFSTPRSSSLIRVTRRRIQRFNWPRLLNNWSRRSRARPYLRILPVKKASLLSNPIFMRKKATRFSSAWPIWRINSMKRCQNRLKTTPLISLLMPTYSISSPTPRSSLVPLPPSPKSPSKRPLWLASPTTSAAWSRTPSGRRRSRSRPPSRHGRHYSSPWTQPAAMTRSRAIKRAMPRCSRHTWNHRGLGHSGSRTNMSEWNEQAHQWNQSALTVKASQALQQII